MLIEIGLMMDACQDNSRQSEGLNIRGCQYYLIGVIRPHPLVEIELTELPKSGDAMVAPAPPGTISLNLFFIISCS